MVDEDEVAHPDVAEAHREGVDPEQLGELGVAHRDVPGDALTEADAAEDAQGAGELLLAVEALLLDRGEGGRPVEVDLLGGQLDPVDGTDARLGGAHGATLCDLPARLER